MDTGIKGKPEFQTESHSINFFRNYEVYDRIYAIWYDGDGYKPFYNQVSYMGVCEDDSPRIWSSVQQPGLVELLKRTPLKVRR